MVLTQNSVLLLASLPGSGRTFLPWIIPATSQLVSIFLPVQTGLSTPARTVFPEHRCASAAPFLSRLSWAPGCLDLAKLRPSVLWPGFFPSPSVLRACVRQPSASSYSPKATGSLSSYPVPWPGVCLLLPWTFPSLRLLPHKAGVSLQT